MYLYDVLLLSRYSRVVNMATVLLAQEESAKLALVKVNTCENKTFFSAPNPKSHVLYCTHQASVVCLSFFRPSIRVSYFNILLWNQYALWYLKELCLYITYNGLWGAVRKVSLSSYSCNKASPPFWLNGTFKKIFSFETANHDLLVGIKNIIYSEVYCKSFPVCLYRAKYMHGL